MNDEFRMNRIANASNSFQGGYKRVLCVCSAGLLRSPTTAVVLSQAPFNFNTRAAGLVNEFALIPVDDVLLHWADEVVCMEPSQAFEIERRLERLKLPSTKVICLGIQDSFPYRDEVLMDAIAKTYVRLAEQAGTEIGNG